MNNEEKTSSGLPIPFASRFETVLLAVLGCMNIVLLAVLLKYTEIEEVLIAVSVVFIYLAEAALIGLYRVKSQKVAPVKNITELLSENGSVVFKASLSPIVVFDSYGTVLWYNDAMREALGSYENFIEKNVTDVFQLTEEQVLSGDSTVSIGGYIYSVEGFVLSEKGNGLYLALFTDRIITDI